MTDQEISRVFPNTLYRYDLLTRKITHSEAEAICYAVNNISASKEAHKLELEHRVKLQSQLVEKDKRIAELEAKIDALMLEHCPEELTTGQFDKWRDCQVISNSFARAALGDKDAIHELRKQAEAWKVEGLSEFKD